MKLPLQASTKLAVWYVAGGGEAPQRIPSRVGSARDDSTFGVSVLRLVGVEIRDDRR